ncbi:MAG TPA: Imm26 family immunity protein [Verrucomicrobiae bacterium]|jgi:hypothetical protein
MKCGLYSEGDWLYLSLPNGGYVIGLIARSRPGSPIFLGYFFGPRRITIPILEDCCGLTAEKAIAVLRCSDLYIRQGKWKLLGRLSEWQRDKWPSPGFVRKEPISNKVFKVVYSDTDPSKMEREILLPCDDSNMPRNFLAGAAAAELYLDMQLQMSPHFSFWN